MPEIDVRMAENEVEFEAARGLCREWFDWHWRHFPEDGPRDSNPLDPATFPAVIAALPELHARPTGAIFVATVDGLPAGCVMYEELAPGIAEFKRLFVSEAGRGHGLGRRMLLRMFEAMRADGYHTVRFSSARFLTHARSLYENLGFLDIAHPDGFPDNLRSFVYFMERPLDRDPG